MWKQVLLSVSALAFMSCGEADVDAALEQCQSQTCPAGTAQKTELQVASGYDISLGFDPTTYAAEGAFGAFGEGECKFYCEVINPCPEGTFPVMNLSCFTCGVVAPDGMSVNQGSCQGL